MSPCDIFCCLSIQLYEQFVAKFEDKLNQLQLVRIATRISLQYCPSRPYSNDELDRAIEFLSKFAQQRETIGEAAFLVTAMEIASLQLKKRNAKAAQVHLPDPPLSEAEARRREQIANQCKPEEATKPSGEDADDVSGAKRDPGTDVTMALDESGSSSASQQHLSGVNYCKRALENEAETLRAVKGSGVPPVVQATYYRVAAEYFKVRGPAGAYFRNAMQYLVFTPRETLSEKERHALAVDIALAALVGADVFNFGELVRHPILASLEGTSEAWLADILNAFQHGDIEAFNTIVSRNRDAFERQPALAAAGNTVKEKMTLLAVMELVSRRPPHERTIKFSEIAAVTGLADDQVEWMLMRAMSLGLLRGHMDQVSGTISVSFVKPRVLDQKQIERLRDGLAEWRSKVHDAHVYMQEHTAELFS